MLEFELTFMLEELSDDVADKLLDSFDCVTGIDHDGRGYITLSEFGIDAQSAATKAAMALRGYGLRPMRLQPDLVGRAEIAERAGVTPQAVGNWVRGDRYRADRFPAMFSEAAGGVWLWGDVLDWLHQRGMCTEETLRYPTLNDVDRLNVELSESASQTRAFTVPASITFDVHRMPIRERFRPASPVSWREEASIPAHREGHPVS